MVRYCLWAELHLAAAEVKDAYRPPGWHWDEQAEPFENEVIVVLASIKAAVANSSSQLLRSYFVCA
jgi:hypothetical protein